MKPKESNAHAHPIRHKHSDAHQLSTAVTMLGHFALTLRPRLNCANREQSLWPETHAARLMDERSEWGEKKPNSDGGEQESSSGG